MSNGGRRGDLTLKDMRFSRTGGEIERSAMLQRQRQRLHRGLRGRKEVYKEGRNEGWDRRTRMEATKVGTKWTRMEG